MINSVHEHSLFLFLQFFSDLATKENKSLRGMASDRYLHSTVAHDGYIYAIGGRDSRNTLRTAER